MSLLTELQASITVAKQFEEDGYVVTLEPSNLEIPFDLGNYRPDILAVKPNDCVIIEVKQSTREGDREKYLRVAEIVAQHPGWSFKLVTVPKQFIKTASLRNGEIEQIPKLLVKVDRLLSIEGMESIAIVPLWNVYVTALQFVVFLQYEPSAVIKRSDLGLLSLAYSLGVLSNEQLELAKSMLSLRNKVAHSLNVDVPMEQIRQLREQIDSFLVELKLLPSIQ